MARSHFRFLVIALLFSFSLPLLSGVAHTSERPPVFLRTLRIAGDNNFPPYEFLAENGAYKGFNVDLLHAVAIEMGLDIELVPMPWSEAQKALQEGRVDAIQGMKLTPDRQKVYDFSDPYLTSSQAIFVRVDNHFIIDLEDLSGNKVAVQKGDFAYDLLQPMARVRLTVTENQEEALDLLLAGKVDAFVGNRLTGLYFLGKKQAYGQVKIVGEPINPTPYGLAVRRGDQEILKVFNAGLRRIKENGTYDKIYFKWFGETIEDKADRLRKILYFVLLATLIVLVVSFGIWRWNQLLRQEVKRRTRELEFLNQRLREQAGEIEESNRLKEQILNSVYIGIVTLDRHGVILSANARARQLVGSELVGQHYRATTLLAFLGEEDLLATLQSGQEFIGREKEVALAQADWRVTESGAANRSNQAGNGREPGAPEPRDDSSRDAVANPTGLAASPRIFRYNVSPLRDEAGQVLGAVVILRDITADKLIAQRLIQEDKMETVGRLVAALAHEIRNPLTALKTFAELLPVKFDKPHFREEASRHIPAEIDRLNLLISDLLDYSRPRPPQIEECRVTELIQSTLALFTKEIRQKGIAVEMSISDDVRVRADHSQLRQVLINLILNSLAATAPGGHLRFAAKRIGPKVALSVEDDGRGMTAEEQERAFEPFFTTKRDGIGLGLYVSYQLVKENGGEITLASWPGQGTRVTLELPGAEV
ncbi:MAG: transporter substrate-binding domain-containing protein [Firmicutes bacterium]|nr:transporter substrate-binding domain-containing protein [Bacillota bacterium]